MKKIPKKKQTAFEKHIEKKKINRNKKVSQNNKQKKKKKKKKKEDIKIENKQKEIKNNKLEDFKIKDLIRNIFNAKEARRQLLFLRIDYKNISPDINDEIFKKCCEKLQKIDEIINSKTINHKNKKDKFFTLSKEYYKIIPHIFPLSDYNSFLINDLDKIKREICLLELIKSFFELENTFFKIKNYKEENDLNSLNDSINLSVNNLENLPEQGHHPKISDAFFKRALSEFNFTFSYIEPKTFEYKQIEQFMNLYSSKNNGPFPPLELLDLFRINKENEKFDKRTFKKKHLFWYGCEIVHFYSILKNNLRLPFKYAPKNAFSYGKGILISDNVYGQIQKCLPKNGIAYLFVCSADKLENSKKVHVHHRNYPEHLPPQYNSVMIVDNIKFSLNEESTDYFHSYNFIFYDPELIKLEYIAKLKLPN